MSEDSKQIQAVIIHISDTHFGEFLGATKNEKGLPCGGRVHVISTLRDLNTAYMKLLHKYTNIGAEVILVHSGDITALGNQEAFESASTVLRGTAWTSAIEYIGFRGGGRCTPQEIAARPKSNPRQSLRPSAFLTVPGNHDIFFRWIRKNTKQYDHYFEDDIPQVIPIQVGFVSLVFFTLDTNRLKSWFGLEKPFINLRNTFGKGRVGNDQIERLKERFKNIDNLPEGFDLDKSIRIALMHHPIVGKLYRPKQNDPKLYDRFLYYRRKLRTYLTLEDRDKVGAALNELGTDIILCGHEHYSYLVEPGANPLPRRGLPSSLMVCAGTACQHEEYEPSFMVYEIHSDSNQYSVKPILYRYTAHGNTGSGHKPMRFRFEKQTKIPGQSKDGKNYVFKK